MNYSAEQFFALLEEVERQGGTHLDEECAVRVFDNADMTGEVKVSKAVPNVVIGCSQTSVFEIPYKSYKRGVREEQSGTIKVCAVEDAVGLWPRFQKAVAAA